MNQIVIQQALNNLYNEGKITIKEKGRIGGLPIKEALEIEVFKQELHKVAEISGIENIAIKLIKGEKITPSKNPNENINYAESIIEKTYKDKPENEDEDRLKLVANIILVVGIISALIIFFSTALVTIEGLYRDKTIFSWAGFATVITTLLYSIGGWAFLNVVSNISISLKEIKGSN